jgi:hypothetical protein
VTGSTSSQEDIGKQAVDNVSNGNASFHVLGVSSSTNGVTYYLVSVPRALVRNGMFGRTTQGSRTRFGDDLFDTLRAMKGIDVGFDHDVPHLLTVITEPGMTEGPPSGFSRSSRGLPGSVCFAVEGAILRNNGPVQRFAEWLRRLP